MLLAILAVVANAQPAPGKARGRDHAGIGDRWQKRHQVGARSHRSAGNDRPAPAGRQWTPPPSEGAVGPLPEGSRPPSHARLPSHGLYVDRSSLGGACSDRRPAAEVGVAAPWCSLERAAAAAPPGTIVHVRAGVYPQLRLNGARRPDYVTLRAMPGEQVTVDGFDIDDSSHWRFEGFRITDLTHMEPNEGPLEPGTVLDHIQFVGNELTGFGQVVASGQDLLFEDNYVHDVEMTLVPNGEGNCHRDPRGSSGRAPRCGHGFRIGDASRVVMRGNRLIRIPADGIQLNGVHDSVFERNSFEEITPFIDPHEHNDGIQLVGDNDRNVIRANVFVQGANHGIIAQPLASGAHPGAPDDLLIENNLFVGRFGMNVYNASGVRVINNTAWNTSISLRLAQIPGPGTMTGAVVKNNVLQQFEAPAGMLAEEDHNLIAVGDRRGPHDISTPPSFVDAAARDYRLRAGSAGIDAGTSHGTPTSDHHGTSRFDDPAKANTGGGGARFYDLGAFEYQPPVARSTARRSARNAARRRARRRARQRQRTARTRSSSPPQRRRGRAARS